MCIQCLIYQLITFALCSNADDFLGALRGLFARGGDCSPLSGDTVFMYVYK